MKNGLKISSLNEKQMIQFKEKIKEKGISVLNIPIERKDVKDSYPLSRGQERLWFLCQLDENVSNYNLFNAIEIEENIDSNILQKSIDILVARHESLRTSFGLSEGIPCQMISDKVHIPLKFVDLSEYNNREKIINDLLTKESRKPFDLSVLPLMRIVLYKLNTNHYVFLLNIHHIISDGWSIQIITKELIEIYNFLSSGHKVELEQINVRYVDYASWQREWFEDDFLKKEISYWEKELKDIPSFFSLPYDKQRPSTQTFNGDIHYFEIKNKLLKRLKQLCKKYNVSMYTLMLTAFYILLYKYTYNEDIVVGTPTAGRCRSEIEGVVGFFVNNLVINAKIKENMKFSDILNIISKKVVNAIDNQNIPFEKIIEIADPIRDLSYSPLFQIFFIYQNIREQLDGSNVKWKQMEFGNKCSKFDITLEIIEKEEKLIASIEYNTDLYFADTIANYSKHYIKILELICENDSILLSDVKLISTEEYKNTMADWKQTYLPVDKSDSIHNLFEKQVKATPSNKAIIFKDKIYTYEEVNEYANSVANYLNKMGIKAGMKIGVHLDRKPSLIFILMGILKNGCTYIPIDPTYPEKRIKYIIDNSNLQLIITEDYEKLIGLDGVCIVDISKDNSIWLQDKSNYHDEKGFNSNRNAYIIYTSGSTGNPKGVCVSHKNVVNFLISMQNKLNIKETDRIFSITTFSFDISVLEMFLPLVSGACTILIEKEAVIDGKEIQKKINNYHPTFIQGTPAFWKMLVASGWNGMHELNILCGGEELKKDLSDQLISRCKNLWNMYGPTETTIWSLMDKIGNNIDKITIGRPINNTYTYILDDSLNIVPIGVAGDLYIGGSGVSNGYYNDEIQTKERFILDPYSKNEEEILFATGDRAKYLSNGKVVFLGRKDNQLKIRGFRIEPGEVEELINEYNDVDSSVVVGLEDSFGEKKLVAFVKIKKEFDISDLKLFLKEKLPEYMIPTTIKVVKDFILTPNLKIDRKRVLECSLVETDSKTKYEKPHTELEEKICSVWSKVLCKESIGINDNFFELGGYSLLAVNIITKLQNELGISIPIKWIFYYPTVADLATNIEKNYANMRDKSVLNRIEISSDLEHLYEPFPLTEVQMAYWTGRNNNIGLGNISTHIYHEIEMKNLDLNKLTKALNQVINRHDMLKAIITSDGMQKILEKVPYYEIEIQDLRGLSKEEKEEKLNFFKDKLSHQVLDDGAWPLFDIKASIIQDNITRLHISFDLLISDAWSFQIVMSEIAYFYTNQNAELEKLHISFRDYVLESNKINNSKVYEKSKKYWINRLNSIPEAPQLPLKINPSDIIKPTFRRWEYVMPKTLWNKVTNKLKKLNITKTVFLATSFSSILSLWSEKSHFTLNLTLSNRMPIHPQINNIIGDFTSITLLEVDFRKTVPFIDRLKNIQEQLLSDIENRFYSGIRVTESLMEKGYLKESFPVVFTSLLDQENQLESNFDSVFEVVNREETMKNSISQTPQIWLDHQGIEENGELHFNWDVVDGLFPDGMIDNMFNAYCQLLNDLAISEEPWKKISLTNHDFTNINNRINEYSEKMLHSSFTENVDKVPSAIAIETSNMKITYGQLNNCSNIIAKSLSESGMAKSEYVAVIMEKGWEQIAAVLGILRSGGAYVPIDISTPIDRINTILSIGNITKVIVSGKENNIILPEGIETTEVKENMLYEEAEDINVPNDPDSLAYVIFTSGSTGVPKGVMITHRGAVNTIEDINRRFDINEKDKIFGIASLSFDLSVYDIFGTLSAGGTLVLPDSDKLKDPSHWNYMIEKSGVTVWNSVPALMGMLVEYVQGQAEYESLRLVMLSGDWIPINLPEKIKAFGNDIKVVSLGGATEASIWSILYNIENIEKGLSSIPYGKSMNNQSVYVLNDRFDIRPIGVPGEIYIGGLGLAKGYLGDEQKTRESFIVHPVTGQRLYRTGDFGRYMNDGNIEFLGRRDMQIKIGGFRIELGEIESVLKNNKYVKDAAVIIEGNDLIDKHIDAYVVIDEKKLSKLNNKEDEEIILDSTKRFEFKLSEPSLRKDLKDEIQLSFKNYGSKEYFKRRSFRIFQKDQISLEDFSKLLSCLSSIKEKELPFAKYLYSSAGAVYPVQVYIYIKENRIENMKEGYYYYNPSKHTLSLLSNNNDARDIHVKDNKPVYDESAFSIFLISNLKAITPLYGKDKGQIYSYIEAGIITELLKVEGINLNIGFCEIGLIDFDKIKHNFKLDSSELYLHTLLGGSISNKQMNCEAIAEENMKIKKASFDYDEDSEDLIESRIKKYLEEKLPHYMVPKNIFKLKSIPLTSNGKVNIKAVKLLNKSQRNIKRTKSALISGPRNHLEETISNIWKKILNIDDIGIEDNFFDLGGNSFRIVQVYKELQQQLNINLTITDLFRFPTIKSFSEYIREGSKDQDIIKQSVNRAEMRQRSRRMRR